MCYYGIDEKSRERKLPRLFQFQPVKGPPTRQLMRSPTPPAHGAALPQATSGRGRSSVFLSCQKTAEGKSCPNVYVGQGARRDPAAFYFRQNGEKTMIEKRFLRMMVADLIPYEKNPRNHTQESIEDVKQSIKQCGDGEALDPIEIDENNVILAGHGRRLAMMELGIEETDVFRNHSKVMAIKGERFDCVIESSANINTNPRSENTVVTVDRELTDHYVRLFGQIKPFNKDPGAPPYEV